MLSDILSSSFGCSQRQSRQFRKTLSEADRRMGCHEAVSAPTVLSVGLAAVELRRQKGTE